MQKLARRITSTLRLHKYNLIGATSTVYALKAPLRCLQPCSMRFASTQSVESIYQRKTPIEHVLDRPDTYVGTVLPSTKRMFVLDGWEKYLEKQDASALSITLRDVNYIPAMYRIIDELLVNAVDNYNRPNTGTNALKIELNIETGWISVYNNGKSVPVVLHEKENMMVPELVFGYLLTGMQYLF